MESVKISYYIPNKVMAQYFLNIEDIPPFSSFSNESEKLTTLEHVIMRTNSMKKVVEVIKRGADVNMKNMKGERLIHRFKDNYLRTKILLQNGAAPVEE
jgi:hypothetical protein